MKNLLNINGAQKLSKNEQQSINGGGLSYVCVNMETCVGQCNGDCGLVFGGEFGNCYECLDNSNNTKL